MHTLWLRAETKLNERRTPLIPAHAGILVKNGYRVCVEASRDRIFSDSEYREQGCILVEKGSWRFASSDTLILGLKELPEESFPLRHRHFYFAHAYERQTGSVDLLDRFRRGGGFLYDLEQIKDPSGAQLVTGGAGYLAGLCAATACLDIWKQRQCERTGAYRVPSQFGSCAEIVAYASTLLATHVQIPRILVIGHRGKSGSGVAHLLDEVGLEFDRSPKITNDNIERRALLHQYDIVFNCIKLSKDTPIFLSKDMINSDTRIGLIGDVSCEPTHPDNPIPIYSAPTNFEQPVFRTPEGIDVMAIDNITAMLPVECSQILSEQIFPYLCYFLLAQGVHEASPFARVVNSFNLACRESLGRGSCDAPAGSVDRPVRAVNPPNSCTRIRLQRQHPRDR
ncbi:Rossmann-fold NAD(P)-binding domain-containing protein [Paraburkholderia sediminicola]|uniref:alanine dehydrogenase/PNT domain protein n=1 Tax=Paraburkholderia sediminicola TaxID=458836 RepID=UPI0038BB23FB